jgi:hypothetical protein
VDEAWLTTVRIARDCGDISSLFPVGITRLWDLPYTIMHAIRLALVYLSWEQLPKEEQPPKKIWLDNDRLESWFAEVTRNRESKARGEGDHMAMPQNALLKQMMGRTHG